MSFSTNMIDDKIFPRITSWNLKGRLVSNEQPLVMGILNVTPDSFYDGGRFNKPVEIQNRIEAMVIEGADIIDVGGYSSRPGATDISVEEEMERVIPVIGQIKNRFPEVAVSIDTFRAKVAKKAIEEGADIINDITGGEGDMAMFDTVAEMKVPYVLMHMKGNPKTMQSMTGDYKNLINDIVDYFEVKIKKLQMLGVNDIIIDPGFGFAKTIDQNYELLEKLNYFNMLKYPILAGLSRKSMIYKKLNISPDESLVGTSVLNTIALIKGATILRVHDIKEARATITLFREVYK